MFLWILAGEGELPQAPRPPYVEETIQQYQRMYPGAEVPAVISAKKMAQEMADQKLREQGIDPVLLRENEHLQTELEIIRRQNEQAKQLQEAVEKARKENDALERKISGRGA